MKRVDLMIEDVPAELRAAVDADAVEKGKNRNDVICAILARSFRVRFEPTGYPHRDQNGAKAWYLRMPEELRSAIQARAERQSKPGKQVVASRLIIATLQKHYGLEVDSPTRRIQESFIAPEIVEEARRRNKEGVSIRSLAAEYGLNRETLRKAIRRPA